MLLLYILFAFLVSVPFSFILVELIDRSIKANENKRRQKKIEEDIRRMQEDIIEKLGIA